MANGSSFFSSCDGLLIVALRPPAKLFSVRMPPQFGRRESPSMRRVTVSSLCSLGLATAGYVFSTVSERCPCGTVRWLVERTIVHLSPPRVRSTPSRRFKSEVRSGMIESLHADFNSGSYEPGRRKRIDPFPTRPGADQAAARPTPRPPGKSHGSISHNGGARAGSCQVAHRATVHLSE